MGRWHLHIRTKKPTAKEQSALRRTQALAHCQLGKHTSTKTFRISEEVCTVCGFITYCPGCLKQQNLSLPVSEHARALECSTHQHVEVQA